MRVSVTGNQGLLSERKVRVRQCCCRGRSCRGRSCRESRNPLLHLVLPKPTSLVSNQRCYRNTGFKWLRKKSARKKSRNRYGLENKCLLLLMGAKGGNTKHWKHHWLTKTVTLSPPWLHLFISQGFIHTWKQDTNPIQVHNDYKSKHLLGQCTINCTFLNKHYIYIYSVLCIIRGIMETSNWSVLKEERGYLLKFLL